MRGPRGLEVAGTNTPTQTLSLAYGPPSRAKEAVQIFIMGYDVRQ